MQNFLWEAFVYLAATVLVVPFAKHFRIGAAVGYLIAGIIIGPYLLKLVGSERETVLLFAEFGLVMVLFLEGLQLQPTVLWNLRRSIFGMGSAQLTLSTIAIGTLAWACGLTWQTSILLGSILSLSSSAITMQALEERGHEKTAVGQSSFSVLLFQDLAAIPLLAIFPLLLIQRTHSIQESHGTSTHPAWLQAILIICIMGAIVASGKYLLRPIFRFIARLRSRELFTATALVLIIAITLIMELTGIPPALGAFLAGVVLANNEYRYELEADIEPFKGLLVGLFFVSVGACLNFGAVINAPALTASIVLALILLKIVTLFIVGRIFNLSLTENFLFSISLAQGSEFAFVFFSFSANAIGLPENIASLLNAAVALSMLFSPLFVHMQQYFLNRVTPTHSQNKEFAPLPLQEHPVIIAGFGRFGQIVGRFLRANNIGCTILELNADTVFTLEKFDQKAFYGDATRVDLLESAGIAKAKVFIIAIDEAEKCTELATLIKKLYPHLHIMARAYDVIHAHELHEAGADIIERETFSSSLDLGIEALRALGFRAHFATRAARLFRKHDEKAVREMASIEKMETYVSLAKRRARELEKLLQRDNTKNDSDIDKAWDLAAQRSTPTEPTT